MSTLIVNPKTGFVVTRLIWFQHMVRGIRQVNSGIKRGCQLSCCQNAGNFIKFSIQNSDKDKKNNSKHIAKSRATSKSTFVCLATLTDAVCQRTNLVILFDAAPLEYP